MVVFLFQRWVRVGCLRCAIASFLQAQRKYLIQNYMAIAHHLLNYQIVN
ncbi:MAG: hypothetical protein RM338_32045 [Nostoc sp. DedQUE12a]|nr:hypothetical protein [Nostoc sp. DedQUE12a]